MVKAGLDKAECDTGPLKAEPTIEALWDKMAEPLSTTPHCWPSPSKGEGMSSAGRLLQLELPWRGPPRALCCPHCLQLAASPSGRRL